MAVRIPLRCTRRCALTDDVLQALVWSRPGMAEIIRPWARKMLIEAEEDVPSPLVSLNFKDTLSVAPSISCDRADDSNDQSNGFEYSQISDPPLRIDIWLNLRL